MIHPAASVRLSCESLLLTPISIRSSQRSAALLLIFSLFGRAAPLLAETADDEPNARICPISELAAPGLDRYSRLPDSDLGDPVPAPDNCASDPRCTPQVSDDAIAATLSSGLDGPSSAPDDPATDEFEAHELSLANRAHDDGEGTITAPFAAALPRLDEPDSIADLWLYSPALDDLEVADFAEPRLALYALGPATFDPYDSAHPGLEPDDPAGTDIAPAEAAAAPTAADRPYWRTNIFKRLVYDQGYFVVKWVPYEATRPKFAIPFLVATLSAAFSTQKGVLGYDLTVERTIDEMTSGRADNTARVFSDLGEAVGPSLIIGVTYVLARHAGNDRLAEASSLSFEAIVDAGIWTEVIKRIAARVRPSSQSQGGFFEYNYAPARDLGSFPSGHASGAFAFATIWAHVYADTKWVPWVAYGTATMIAISRVALGRHYPSDVIAGAMLGNSLGRMVLARQDEHEARKLSLREFSPFYDPVERGFGIAYARSW